MSLCGLSVKPEKSVGRTSVPAAAISAWCVKRTPRKLGPSSAARIRVLPPGFTRLVNFINSSNPLQRPINKYPATAYTKSPSNKE